MLDKNNNHESYTLPPKMRDPSILRQTQFKKHEIINLRQNSNKKPKSMVK